MGLRERIRQQSVDFSIGNWTPEQRLLFTFELSYGDGSTFKPDWWQARYLLDDTRFMVVNKSRRIGWSYITALKGLLKAIDPGRHGYTKQFISYSLDDAKEKIAVAREHYYSIPAKYRFKKLVSDTKTVLEFQDVNGRSRSRLISLPCKMPRGKGGDISLDEFAFHPKDDEIYTGALPVISRGGDLEIGSTPFGNGGRFYEILVDSVAYPQFRRWAVPWFYSPALCTDVHAAKDDRGLSSEQLVMRYGTEIIQQIFRSMPLEDFQQEYECFFRDATASFITLEAIRACTPTGDHELPRYTDLESFVVDYDPKKHGTLYAGYDVGRTNDASELIVIGYDGERGKKTVLATVSLRQVSFDRQEALLQTLMHELPVQRLVIDATGLGMHLAENLHRKHTRRVEAVTFTNQVKENLAENMWLGFDARDFVLPADRELQSQIHAIRKTMTTAHNIRFDVDRNVKHHGDKFWAMALANSAVNVADRRKTLKEQVEERRSRRGGKRGKTVDQVVSSIAAGG